MTSDNIALYHAFASRDPRFDGVFFVGVTSTGIYCRPVCTARTPKAANCRFFDSAEAAEKALFRPCLRCRPELAPGTSRDSVLLLLTYRAPFDWAALLRFLRPRSLRGVEWIDETAYRRTVQLGSHSGWVCITHAPEKRALVVELAHSLTPVLPALLGRLRHLFDLDARPDVIVELLAEDALLAGAVARNPGLRIPGAFDGFEMAVRAILGQQITVKAATTIAGRVANAFGEPLATPFDDLAHRSPSAERVADASVEEIARLGIIRARAQSILALAREVAEGRLRLEPGADPETTMGQLVALPGIGAWTAHYVAMRALCWPDAFPKEDVVLRKRLGGVSGAQAEVMSQSWRPWRSYAALHLWQS